MERITLIRDGNLITVKAPDRYAALALDVLRPELTYTETVMLRGRDLYAAIRADRPKMRFVVHPCYFIDKDFNLCTFAGFRGRMERILSKKRLPCVFEDRTPAEYRRPFTPDWNNVLQFVDLRYRQKEFLEAILSHDMGRINVPPGVGKSFLAVQLCRLLNTFTFDIVVPGRALVESMYRDLSKALPSVGIVGCGRPPRKFSERVTVYSAHSLHKSPATADILLGDEIHLLGADCFADDFARYRYARAYGLTATMDQRFDGKDLRTEGYFGDVIFSMGFNEAHENKLIVPNRVIWGDCVVPQGYRKKVAKIVGSVAKKRAGFWRNPYRNRKIAKDAREYGKDVQVLVIVETLDHALHLKALLPEFKLVYAKGEKNERQIDAAVEAGLLKKRPPPMTNDRFRKLRVAFEDAKIKKAIATTVWGTGVNFKQLAVYVRADGGTSVIADTQWPSRTVRLSDGKEFAIIRDYRDSWCRSFAARARGRFRTYKKNDWQQNWTGQKSLFED